MNYREIMRFAILLLFVVVVGFAASAQPPLTGDALFADVEHYAAITDHRTGSAGDRLTARWLALELREAGYTVEEQPWELTQYFPASYSFSFGGDSIDGVYPLWMPPDGAFDIRAPLCEFTPGSNERLAGKIALADGTRITRGRWSTGVNDLVTEAAAAGAEALVFVLRTPSGELATINARAPNHQQPFPIPVMVVDMKREEELMRAAREGVPGRFALSGELRRTTAYNLIATLDRGRPWLVTTTPTSGWFTCAGERGPGVALFLGLARWAAQAELPFSLRFIGNSGHELDNIGAHHSLDAYGPPPEDVACWIHLGASIGARRWELRAGAPVPLEEHNRIGNLVGTADLLPLLREAFRGVPAYQPRSGEPILGELRHFIHAGYRSFGFFGSHYYFHTPLDTAATISPALLAPIGDGLRSAVLQLAEQE